MRVALINPPDPSSSGNSRLVPPLGLGYVASFARRAGHHVDLYDLALDLQPTVEFLTSIGLLGDYDVYGLTSYTDSFAAASELAASLRLLNRQTKIVFGGYHVSLLHKETLRDCPEVDIVVRGEGEERFAEILRILSLGSEDFSNVSSVTWRKSSGEIVANTDDDFLLDQNVLPTPATDLTYGPKDYLNYFDWRLGVSRPSISMVSSRGCPKRCTFCSIAVLNPLWRARSVSSLLNEIEERYIKSPFEHVFFQDANFFVKPTRSLEFSKALREFNPAITWSGTATPDHIVKHPDVITELGTLNCAYIEVGIESGNEASLARYGKGNSVETNRRALQILESAGISVGLDFIMFEPEMTLEDLSKNIDFLKEFQLDAEWPAGIFFQELQMYPGTVARREFLRKTDTLCDDHLVPATRFFDQRVQSVFDYCTDYRRAFQAHTDELIREFYRYLYHSMSGTQVSPEFTRISQESFAAVIRLRHLPLQLIEDIVRLVKGNASLTEFATAMKRPVSLLFKANQQLASLKSQIKQCDVPAQRFQRARNVEQSHV